METSKPRIISSFIEVHTEVNEGEKVVRRHQVIRNGDHDGETSVEDKNKANKSMESKNETKIPISRLRQTVEKVKAKRQNSMEKAKKDIESQIPIRRPSQPKATDPKRSTEDEFDKLYQEVVADDTAVKALETKFEEISHDYDDNKLQPIDVEIVRRSKIPRRSLHDAEGTQERNSRIIAAREKVILRKSLSSNDDKYEKTSKVIVETLNKDGADDNKKGRFETIEIIKVENEKITVDSPVVYTNSETGEIKLNDDIVTEVLEPNTSELHDSGQKYNNFELVSENTTQKELKVTKSLSDEQDNDNLFNMTQTTTTDEAKSRENRDKNASEFTIPENENKCPIEIGPHELKSEILEHTETNETLKTVEVERTLSYNSNEEEFIESKLNNITIETEKLSEDINIFARTNSKEFDSNLTTLDIETTKNDIGIEDTNKSNDLSAENEVRSSQSKTELNNNFINFYLRSRSRNFDTKFDDNDQIKSPKIENIENSQEKEFKIKKTDQKDQQIINPFFDSIEFNKNNIILKEENRYDSNNIKYDKSEIGVSDKVENNKIPHRKEIPNKSEVKTGKDRKNEFVRTFSGKVGRLISKIDSKEDLVIESQTKDPPIEVPKKKSVLSKIAMFESLESEVPKAKPKPKSLKLITKDIQPEVKTHVHVHTPLIVNEIFKPFSAKDEFKPKIEPINESNIEKQFVGDNKDLYYDENKAEISMTIADQSHLLIENDTELYGETNNDAHYLTSGQNSSTDKYMYLDEDISKPYNFEAHKEKVEEVTIPNTPGGKTKHFKYENPEPYTPIDDAPVIIPKVRPVREILSRFEPQYKNVYVEEVFHKGTFRSKVKEAIDELKQADIDVQHILQVKNDVYAEENTDKENKTTDFVEEIDTVENKIQDFHTNRDKVPELQDFTRISAAQNIKINDSSIKPKVLDTRRTVSVADLNPGQAKVKVSKIITRMKSYDRIELDKKEVPINIKEMPRQRSVSEKIALFERLTPFSGAAAAAASLANSTIAPPPIPPTTSLVRSPPTTLTTSPAPPTNDTGPSLVRLAPTTLTTSPAPPPPTNSTAPPPTTPSPTTTTLSSVQIQERVQELATRYGVVEVPTIELGNGLRMPVIAVGTANLEPSLIKPIIAAAIDMGYRAIDTAYIYGNEREVGEALREKIQDGTVKREDLFITSKLWSTFHREDLVEEACNNSLHAMGLDYFDLYLIHNPMSFKEGPNPLPKIATVLQYSSNDYMNAWFGMEPLVTKGLVKGIGVSNFNSAQVARVTERGRVKPVVNQVECHPYLSQDRLDDFCAQRNVTLSCFGVLGSKGTPEAYRGTPYTIIDDPIVKVMASALHITPAQLLIAYQLKSDRAVVVKSSSAAHLWDNLQSLRVQLTDAEVGGLRMMHRNKRIFTFAGMGDTHNNYPFNKAF